MFFRAVSASGGYYDVPENAAFSVAPDLLEDVGLVYWDYYHHDMTVYDKNFRLHKKLTNQIIFAGGGWTWSGLAPNYTKALDTMQAGIESALQNGVKEAVCTFWFDNGMETPAGAYLLPMTAFALLCRGSYGEAEMDRILRKMSGCSMDEWMQFPQTVQDTDLHGS